jgi:L-lactate permease
LLSIPGSPYQTLLLSHSCPFIIITIIIILGLTPQMSRNMQYLPFCTWLISLNTMISSSSIFLIMT